jgi:hypothetical protein
LYFVLSFHPYTHKASHIVRLLFYSVNSYLSPPESQLSGPNFLEVADEEFLGFSQDHASF